MFSPYLCGYRLEVKEDGFISIINLGLFNVTTCASVQRCCHSVKMFHLPSDLMKFDRCYRLSCLF
jgi:hypothetical protein